MKNHKGVELFVEIMIYYFLIIFFVKPPTCHWVKAICLAFNASLCSCDTFSSLQLKVLNTYQPSNPDHSTARESRWQI